jgi:hypothetical protein
MYIVMGAYFAKFSDYLSFLLYSGLQNVSSTFFDPWTMEQLTSHVPIADLTCVKNFIAVHIALGAYSAKFSYHPVFL